ARRRQCIGTAFWRVCGRLAGPDRLRLVAGGEAAIGWPGHRTRTEEGRWPCAGRTGHGVAPVAIAGDWPGGGGPLVAGLALPGGQRVVREPVAGIAAGTGLMP